VGCVAQQHAAIDIALAVADPDALSGGRGLTSRRDSTIDWCASRWIGVRCLPSAVSGVVFLALPAALTFAPALDSPRHHRELVTVMTGGIEHQRGGGCGW
jgi:hypothetical protein